MMTRLPAMSEVSLARPSHAGRRIFAAALGTTSATVWFLIALSLWHAQVPRTWLQDLLLLVGGLFAFLVPCVLVWVIVHGYDWAKGFRR
ncbi:hypothetical protein DNFV4_01991 [Nitrospira tepida]|uniref:Uncharacterized protein n=1 Tax=Nitrospira tepida TaxID=2973512 RepID=A0AA86MYR7_9BACT|nr:hypothetical protein [Nitrospira tepida]CAI4031572.1 hypothetical protein DNFV4_01991 [Nitrospira tepida]